MTPLDVAARLLLFADENPAAFAALARKAFDVMVRRRWFPRFIGSVHGVQRWVAYSWATLCDLRDALPAVAAFCPQETDRFVFSDPFTALVEADRWWVENVEGKPA